MKTVQYLDAVKAALGLDSDYALQRPLQVTKSAISSYRCGKSTFDHLVAARVAKILDIEAVKVIADIEIERAHTEEQRDLWKRIAKKVAFAGGAAIGAALLYKLQSVGADSDQLQVLAIAAVQTQPLCIMSSCGTGTGSSAIALVAAIAALLVLPGYMAKRLIPASSERFA